MLPSRGSDVVLLAFSLLTLIDQSSASVCVVSFWESWGPCVGNCRFALQVRNRDVIRPPFPERLEDGRLAIRPCPVLYQVQTCVLTKCLAGSPPFPTGNGLGNGFNSISGRKSLKDLKEVKYEHPNFLKFGASAGAGNLRTDESEERDGFKVDLQGAPSQTNTEPRIRHKEIDFSIPGKGTAVHERKPTDFNAAPINQPRTPKQRASTRFPWHISTNRIVELKGPAGIPETTFDASRDIRPTTESRTDSPTSPTPAVTPNVFLPRTRAPWNGAQSPNRHRPGPSPDAVEVQTFGQGEAIDPGVTANKYSGTTAVPLTVTPHEPDPQPQIIWIASKPAAGRIETENVVPKVDVTLKPNAPEKHVTPSSKEVPREDGPSSNRSEATDDDADQALVPRSPRVFMPKFKFLTTIAPLTSITPERNGPRLSTESYATSESEILTESHTKMPLIVFRPSASSVAPATSESSSPSPSNSNPPIPNANIAAVHDRPWRGVIKPEENAANAPGWNEIWDLKSGDLPNVGGETIPTTSTTTTLPPTTTTSTEATTTRFRPVFETTTIRVRTRTPKRERQPIIRALTRKPLSRISVGPRLQVFSRPTRRPITSLRWYEIVRLTSPARNRKTTQTTKIPRTTTTRKSTEAPTEEPTSGCGSPDGDPRCCRSAWKSKCPNGRRPQRVVRWGRSQKDRECVPYSYAYCGYEAEKKNGKPFKFEEDCYDLCFSDEEKSSLPIFRDAKFDAGFRQR